METISIVRGNDFKIRIPVVRHVLWPNGQVVAQEFVIDDCEVLKVFLEDCDQHAIELTRWYEDEEHDGNIVANVSGLLPLGTYHLIVAGKQNGKLFRSKERRQLRIVDNNERANMWPIEYDGFEAYNLDTMVILDCRGRDGLSAYEIAVLNGFEGTETQWLKSLAIKRIEKTGTEDLVDTYTITYSNGATSTFEVTNGESAYHMAVRLGVFTGTEEEWCSRSNWPTLDEAVMHYIAQMQEELASKEYVKGERDTLQLQINQILSDKATRNLSISPSTIFVGEPTNITVSVSCTRATAITIRKGSTALATGEGTSLSHIDPNVSSAVTYYADITIAGISGTVNKSVSAVHPIYVGAGATAEAATTKQSAKTSPAGTYNIPVATSGSYVWFLVPNTMSISSAKKNGFNFPLEAPTTTTKDGVTYKVYRSSNTYDAGTETIVIS